MENLALPGKWFRTLLLCVLTAFAVQSCKTGDLNEEVAMLQEKQAYIMAQKDSLQKLLNVSQTQVDTVYANLNKMTEKYKALENKNIQLKSENYKKGEALKKAAAENAALTTALNSKSAENDSLRTVVATLQEKMASVESQKSEADENNKILAMSLQAKEEKIQADSIARANKPKPVKESGFVSINEIGGGFGLGDVSVDYSRSLISFNTIAAYRINKHFTTGVGAGVHVYNGGTLVPVFLDVKYSLKAAKVTPYLFTDAGMNFNFSDFMSSGIFINSGMGIEKRLNERMSFHISSGLLINESPVGSRYTFINIKGGISFDGK